jgi:2-hydroxy-4-carboxymuconate semialdehyde hemiacetal dehydrogenase
MSARCYGRSTVAAMKIALAGAGALGIKHLDALRLIDGVEVVSLIGRELEKPRMSPASTLSVTTDLARPRLDGLDLCTPTQMHADQAISASTSASTCSRDPRCDSLADGRAVVERQRQTGLARCRNASTPSQRIRARPGRRTPDPTDGRRYFFAPTPTLGRAAGPTICCGTAATPSTCSPTRRVARSSPPMRCKVDQSQLGIAMDLSSSQAADGAICRCRCRSTTTDRSARSSATSVIPVRTCKLRRPRHGRDEPVDVSGVDVSMNGIGFRIEFVAAIDPA